MNKKDRRKRIMTFSWLFSGVVRDFYKESRLARKHGINSARKRMSRRHRKRAIQFRITALKMGGVLIKLGQFLSSRVDIMPEEYIEELASLQDEVHEVSFSEIKEVIESEFGKPLESIYKEFNEKPSGAASLAQVHYATLHDSTEVAVKIQRPNIDELINVDLATFSYLMDGVEKFTSFGKKVDIKKVVGEFNRTLGDELDFHREADNAKRFKENFENDDTIYIPQIYWEYSTQKIITLEKIKGIKINHYQILEKNGISRAEVAIEVAQSYFKQILEHGFFHADPHPGNIFVAEGPKITFVDFGMVGQITPETKNNLKKLAVGVATTNVDEIINSFILLGFLRKGVGSYSVKNAVKWMLENYSSLTTNTLSIDDIEEINEDLKKIMRDEPFTIPAEFAFLGRAIGALHGLSIGLDPNFNAIESVTPYVKKLTQEESSNYLNIIAKEGMDLLKLLITLPRKIDEFITTTQKGNTKFKVDAKEIVHTLDVLNKSQKTTSLAVISSVLLGSSAYLFTKGFENESYLFGGFGFIVVFLILFSGRKEKRKYF